MILRRNVKYIAGKKNGRLKEPVPVWLVEHETNNRGFLVRVVTLTKIRGSTLTDRYLHIGKSMSIEVFPKGFLGFLKYLKREHGLHLKARMAIYGYESLSIFAV